MRPRVDDGDGQARAASQELDKIALGLVAERSERDLFREKSRKTAVVGIEVEAVAIRWRAVRASRRVRPGSCFCPRSPGLAWER